MKDKKIIKFKPSEWLLEMILIVLIIVFGFTATNFFTMNNFMNILRNISFKGIIACFMTMVIISGEIDLSVGSIVAFSGVFNAYLAKAMMTGGMDPVPAIIISVIATLAVDAVIGSFIAVLVTKLKVPAFIATLAFMQLGKGAALLISKGFPIQGFPSWFKIFGNGKVAGIPIPAIFFAVFLIIVWFILRHTPFGRSIYAIGSNQTAAALSGINVVKVKTLIFMFTAMASGLAGILVTSQMNSGSPQIGTSYEMDTISAVIIGGASMSGGAGTIRGTLVGSIFIGVLINALTLMGVSDYWQYVVRGLLIVFAVFLNTMVKGYLREKNL